MMDQQEKNMFYLYSYLKFFWEKKKLFILITLPLLLIALVVSFFQGNNYEATATFSFDNIGDALMDPDLVKANYSKGLPEDWKANFNVFVPKYKKLKFQLTGQDPKQLETYFTQITNLYYQDLLKKYEEKLSIYNRYHETQKEKVAKLESTVDLMRKKVNTADSEELRLLVESEKELVIEQQELEQFRLELIDFKDAKPTYVEPVKIEKKPSPYFSNLILAGMLGLFLTFFVLIVWKYVQDAKAALKE